MARLYSNENFPFPAVEVLRQLKHDVLTIRETGQAGQAMSDEAITTHVQLSGQLVRINRPVK